MKCIHFAAVFAVAAFSVLPSLAQEKPVSGENRVDFRYALPWWQTAICLPDDPDKALVGKEGQVLLDYGRAGFRKFGICIEPTILEGVKWVRQQTASPRAPVMQTWKDAAGAEVLEETFVVTPKTGGLKLPADSKRRILILVTLKNTSGAEVVRQPALRIKSAASARYSVNAKTVSIGQNTTISCSENIEGLEAKSNREALLLLAPVKFAPGASRQFAFTVDRRNSRPAVAATAAEARSLCEAALRWWETSDLPFETIQVPDADIQAMIESCVRNIWQAREIKKGFPAFQVGPTVFRGLWIVDGAFLLEAAAILGAGDQARNGVAYELTHQKPDGRIEVMKDKYGYWKENGIVLWTCLRHAMLTQDKAWLESEWPKLQRIAEFIKVLRTDKPIDPSLEAGLIPRGKHTALDKGLMPHGIIDGGIQNGVEYTNTYWNLLGLRSFIEAARWLGKPDEAAAWQKEYDDFYAVFRKAAARDTLKDKVGNAYVPVLMGNAGNLSPQKGQWAFCHAVYPGQIFSQGDPLAESQMAMLRATKVQGLVLDTGWKKDGIWTYFASFYGHAVLWTGHGGEAAQVLYDFANHAAPTRVWREEQKPVGKGTEEGGDMPHNWASAEFIRLAAHLLELDRGDEMHLLEGMPPQWLKAGMTTKLKGVLTPFGPLTMTVQVDEDGKTAMLDVKPLAANCKAIVIHFPDGTLRRLPADKGGSLTFPVR